jgi:glutamate N-acetyltransferase/amino-acid N-acetyltransferase
MLAFVTTDIAASSAELKSLLVEAVDPTFNAITVDGDMSTNDTALVLANGESGVTLDDQSRALFKEALYRVCDCLADKIVSDGERITKVVEILISGAASNSDAENIARAIGNSLLVKTSWYGNDPNWGRLMDALGYADAQIDQYVIDISYDDAPALVSGDPIPNNKPKWKEVVSQSRFTIKIDMHQGDGIYRLRASDLTEGYVDFNKSE